MSLLHPMHTNLLPPTPNPVLAEPQKNMLPDVKEKGKGSLLAALHYAWAGGRHGNNSSS